MTDIVIIDDDKNKSEDTMRYLQEIYPAARFHIKECVRDGLYFLMKTAYYEIIKNPLDWLVVTDMTMPFYARGELETDAGFRILAELERKDMQVPAIVSTSTDMSGFRKIEDESKKAYSLGLLTILSKPASPSVAKSQLVAPARK